MRTTLIIVKWLLFAFVVLLTGCIPNLLIRDSKINNGDYQTISKNIYQIAKTCWVKQNAVFGAGVEVDSVVTIDSIWVSARFGPGMRVMNPFIRFVVMPDDNNNTKIEFYYQDFPWLGQEKHLKDAYNWLSGNYICSQ
jgi:hypothetical protein